MNKTYILPCVTLDSYYFQQKGKSKNLIEENSNKQDVDILKNEISSVKRHVWRNAVKFTNPYESVCKNYNMKISRAYFKLIEILVDFDLLFQDLDHLNTLHLCEGPGGFIEAIKDVRNKQNKHLNWKGITLKNENNDPNLPDFVNSIDKENITYGKDGTGDITNVENIIYLGEMFHNNGQAHLITADGGFDVSEDHCSQEQQSYKLMLSQAVAAMECQTLGGSFIMKVFDCYSDEMVELLYILSIHYTNVFITKPYSSRPCNSEKYIVCKNFRGVSNKECKMLRFFIENIDNMELKTKPDNLFCDILSNINNKFSERQKNALYTTLCYANKTKWVHRPENMSNWFIDYYVKSSV